MKKYQELENKIQELQKEVDRLKQEEENNKLPENFSLENTLKFLENPEEIELISKCFTWENTPQGHSYWDQICFGYRKLSDKDIIQLQKWCIMALQQQVKK